MAESSLENGKRGWIDGLSRGIPPGFPDEILGAIEEAWRSLARSYQRGQLPPASLDTIEARLEGLESFHDIRGFSLLDAWEVIGRAPPFVLCIATRLVPATEGLDNQLVARHECRIVGLFELQEAAGSAMIRPESLRDSVSELFRPRELDFPDNLGFCRAYYVMASDEEAFRHGLPRSIISHLGGKEDLFIELHERNMVVFWDAVVGEVSVVEACDFLAPISTIVTPKVHSPYR